VSPAKLPPDDKDRKAAIAARGVNVLVDAGAGTGKTTILVKRLVEMVAPAEDATPAVPLDRIAAVTFTRKAAGELKLRIRERLLGELAGRPSTVRRERLSSALAAMDTALVGTIHGFADRLLRRRPVEAWLSPSYEILEDASALAHETFEILLHASENGTLAEELEGTGCDRKRAEEAAGHIRAVVEAGLLAETKEGAWKDKNGLDALVASFIEHRDVPPPDAKLPRFDPTRVHQAISEFVTLAKGTAGPGKGSRWIARLAGELRALAKEDDPSVLYRGVKAAIRYKPSRPGMAKDFPGDDVGWEAWKAWGGSEKKGIVGYATRMCGPLDRWLATRLVRTFPAVIALYEKVKARHRAVDQVDLLLSLRNLLACDLDVRREMQGLFDHVFVDEFQDTDPLQAEIILFLCEKKPLAATWKDVVLAPGKLTLVGDPKQSIYRFRRADITAYESVRQMVMKGPHLPVRLTANFRSQPVLLTHMNGRFDEILGKPQAGMPDFDVARGSVVNRALDAGRDGTATNCVAVLPFANEKPLAGPDRLLEAKVVATWLRAHAGKGWNFRDVAILAHVTSNVWMLTGELDRMGVPWSARGGTLFLQDPLHKQFLLALRAIADGGDGVGMAALLRDPFFAVDLADLVRAEAAAADSTDAGVVRARAAEAFVQDLRRRRLERPPGETARDLLERTGLARSVAFGPNGRQRLERLRELCFELERVAAAEGLDFDGATARLREWALDPVKLDPPRPVGDDAVQIMTIHQAKGLEFPVVVWWDAHAPMAPVSRASVWHVDRERGSWVMDLDGLSWEEPEGDGLRAREDAFEAAERRRLIYVAATRAKELLVLPVAVGAKGTLVTPALVGTNSPAIEPYEAWTEEKAPAWTKGVKPPPARKPKEAKSLTAAVEKEWGEASAVAGKPLFAPRGISALAHARVEAQAEGEAGARWKERESRFGNVFGETVHLAIGVALREPKVEPAEAVAQVAKVTGLDRNLAEAAEDVRRALAALEREGLRRVPGPDLRLEYPIATGEAGTLLQGYVDLLGFQGGNLVVIDFKTDAPPKGAVGDTYGGYVEQVRDYGRILVGLGLAKAGPIRCGLLFTANGVLHWA
jgi:ATP-dependent helicase/nuclease subunit A